MAHRRKPTDGPTSSTGLRDRIVRWLQESGNYVGMQAVPNMEFAIQGTYPRQVPGGSPLGVFLVKPETERAIAVIANVGFSPEHRAALSRKEPADRQRFFRDLQRELVFHCGLSLQADPQTQEVISIQLSEEVYFDEEPTREDIYCAIKSVHRAYVYISLVLQGLPLSAYLGT